MRMREGQTEPVSCKGGERGKSGAEMSAGGQGRTNHGLDGPKANKCGFQKKGHGHASRSEDNTLWRLLVIKRRGALPRSGACLLPLSRPSQDQKRGRRAKVEQK